MNEPIDNDAYPAPRRVRPHDQKYCSACGELILIHAEICPRCGARQLLPPTIESIEQTPLAHTQPTGGRNRVIAAILAILLGGFGAHRFYFGQIWLGILYLLFSWTSIPSIVGIIEGILYLLMSDEDFDRKYNHTRHHARLP